MKKLTIVSPSDPSDRVVENSKLRTRKAGRRVSIESTLEIKTRVAHKPIALDEVVPQLWVSQTPNLVRAYHNRGVFQVPEVENVDPQIKRWEDPAYVQQQARDRLNLVMPGEKKYMVIGGETALPDAQDAPSDPGTVNPEMPWADGLWDSVVRAATD